MTTKAQPADTSAEPSADASAAPSNGANPSEPAKPVTIMLPDETLKRLKIVAIMRSTSVSELVADAAAQVVKRELKKALSKLGE